VYNTLVLCLEDRGQEDELGLLAFEANTSVCTLYCFQSDRTCCLQL